MIDDKSEYERKTPAQREADKSFKRIDAVKALSDHEAAQIAFHKNRERLRAERLAREAAAKEVPQAVRKTPRETSTRVRWTSSDNEKLLAMIAVGRSYEDVAVHTAPLPPQYNVRLS